MNCDYGAHKVLKGLLQCLILYIFFKLWLKIESTKGSGEIAAYTVLKGTTNTYECLLRNTRIFGFK